MIDQRLNIGMPHLGPLRRVYHAANVLRRVWLVSVLLLSSALAAADSSNTYAHRTLHGLQGIEVEMEAFIHDYLAMNLRPEEGNVERAIPQDGMTQTD